jgi:hypothetical protein
MDGVIANFVKRYKELFKRDPDSGNRKAFGGNFTHFIVTKQFETLEKLPDADLGLEFLRKANVPTQMLSSTGRPDSHDDVSKQKMIWLQSHGITFNPIFVPGKELKCKYANPTSIIIDDTKSVIDDWLEAGGIGIWHKDWPTTLAILGMYV